MSDRPVGPALSALKPLDLEAMKARCDAAAHGPWQRVYGGDNSYEVATKQGLALAVKVHIADAEFIAHARMDVPNLIREVERLSALSGSVGGLNAAPPAKKLTPKQQDDRIDQLGLKKLSKDTLMLMIVDLEQALPASPVCAAEKKALEEKI